MSAVDPGRLNDSLRRLHRSAIASLAICALGIGILAFIQSPSEPSAPPAQPSYSLVALALASVAILLRRSSPARSLRRFVYGSVVSLLGAVGLGVLGLFVALRESQIASGLLYTLAGALLALRPPPTLRSGGAERRTGS